MKSILKYLTTFLLLAVLCPVPVNGQMQLDGIYIQEFKMTDGGQNGFTEDITAQYRMELSNSAEVKIINRTNPQVLALLKENERLLLESEDGTFDMPQTLKEKLRDIGVSLTVEGRIDYVAHDEIYRIRVKYSNIYTKEEIYENELAVLSRKISKFEALREEMKSIIPAQSKLTGTPGEKLEKQLLINASLLDKEKDPWQYFQNVYYEDFSNYRNPNFRSNIWTLNNTKQYWCGVLEGNYCFDIKKEGFSRHKYLESDEINHNTRVQTMPYSVVIVISDTSKCFSNNGCYGRGLSVRYDKSKKSCYAYTLTDDGDLKFLKTSSVFEPEKFIVLHGQHIKIKAGERYKLGIICLGNKFYLYLNDELVKVIYDNAYQTGFNGVFAHGKGVHNFDDVTICAPYFIKN